MAFNDIELQRNKQVLDRFLDLHRPPPEQRGKYDIGFRIAGQSVEIFEIRPDWVDKTKTMETPAAKATFVRGRNRWRVFWMKRDFRWHAYEPAPEAASLDAFLKLVDQDIYACFWG